MVDTRRSPTLRYSVAVLSVAVVTLIRYVLRSLLGGSGAFLPDEVAVMVSAWYGGLRAGLLATALAAFATSYVFLPSNGHFSLDHPSVVVQLALFCGIGTVISFVGDALRCEIVERRLAEQASQAQTRALTRVLEQLTKEHRVEEFPGIILAAIVDQFEAAGGTVWIYDEVDERFERMLDYEGGRVMLADAADHPFPQKSVEFRKMPDWEKVKAGYLRGECLVVTDFSNHPALEPNTRAALADRAIRSLLVVPMLLQGRLLGVFTLSSTLQESYSAHDLALAQALAHQATLAIQMARLAEQARQTAVLEERNRMAREIHDTLAQAFTGILLQLGAAERVMADAPEQGQAHLRSVGDLAREGLAEARRSVQALRPQALETADLAAALARMTEHLNTDPATRIAFRLNGAPRPLPPDVADHLLRIGQEALTNALRHAQAREVCVQLSFADEELRLCVEDDGRGFPTDTPLRREGFGLTGLHERAGILGAQLTVASQPGSGTRIELTWRFPPAES